MRSGVLTGNDTGGAAQVAAAHCPNERTLDPAVCSQTDPPMPYANKAFDKVLQLDSVIFNDIQPSVVVKFIHYKGMPRWISKP